MANITPIQFKRSETPGAVPNPSDMIPGEIALNIADQKIFTKDSDGVIKSMGFHTKRNTNDTIYSVDTAGTVTSSSSAFSEVTVVTDTTDNNWQNSQEILDLQPGTRINVFRNKGEAVNFVIDSESGTESSMNTVGSRYVAILDYNGTASYAFTNSVFDETFRLERAYVSGADHASLGLTDDYFVWQVFDTPVSIGNGTILGQFKNGRVSEYFATTRAEFYNSKGELIVGGTFNNSSSVTNDINLAGGSITDVKTIVLRGDDGPSANPGLNNINFYVNGSTAYPTTSWTSDQKWAGFWRNIGNSANPNPSTEFMGISHVSTNVAGFASGGMWSISRPSDAALAINSTGGNFIFWLNKPWSIAGGTWISGRPLYTNEFFANWDIRYFDANNTQLFQYNRTFTSATTDTFYTHANVSKITMNGTGRNGNYPSLNEWFPQLVTIEDELRVEKSFSDPEVWFRNSDKPTDVYVDNVAGEIPAFKKIIG